MTKRLFDILLAAVALPFAAVVILVLAIAVRITSPGPAIFRQVRVGRDERPFVCLKLRTMRRDTRNAPSHEVDASAVTGIGRFMRATKLDELPQLWNILRGEMSFVGPRPCLPTQTALVAARRARGLYAIRPGITGIAQVAGVDMSDPEKLAALDATYLDRMALGTDLSLIASTFFGAGRGDRVRTTG
jgi:O-antigen biosynthesis protein WbqP